MTQSLYERLSYHPDPRTSSGSHRKVDARFNFIRRKVDLQDKVVLDLGCSGGSFSFAAAQTARHVIAIDGDPEIIARNKEIQNELGVKNIEFHHHIIESATIDQVGLVDVTLLLSVYHHMITASQAYDWNTCNTSDEADLAIEAINRNTETLCFEIGYPDEGYEWCERLPNFGADWDDYVREHVFRGAYRSVDIGPAPTPVSWFAKGILSKLSTPYRRDVVLIQKLKSLFRFDARDLRKIYIGRKGI
jgi:SAM-dependent methyltransferase